MLSRDDIKHAILDGEIQIYPFETRNMTGIGYNLSATNFAFSINQGILLTVYSRTTPTGEKHYVIIPPNDTVLFFSKEFIKVNNRIAGTFHSKVGRVCQGLGHISTTLDPTWQGQLIISINNPTSTEIKFDLDEKSGNIFTLLFYRFRTPVNGNNIHDNNSGRCDLLLERFSEGTNVKYREKHLQLKEYIINEFANSLNGYDDFLNPSIQDKYTKKVQTLQKLKQRLEKDRLLIRENRYHLGNEGIYCPLNNDERGMITHCIMFKVREDTKFSAEEKKERKYIPFDLLLKDEFLDNQFEDALKVLNEYLKIIDYELGMINHNRRVEWQNKKTLEFAGEESELVFLRKKNRKDECVKRMWKVLAAIMLLICSFILAVVCLEIPDPITDIWIAVISGVLALLVPSFWKSFRSWLDE